MNRSYTPPQIADSILAGEVTRDSAFIPLAEVERLRAERDEARAEVERLRAALKIAAVYVRCCHDEWHLTRDRAEASRDLTKIRAVLNDERAGELEAKP
jgi:hypothetical protein